MVASFNFFDFGVLFLGEALFGLYGAPGAGVAHLTLWLAWDYGLPLDANRNQPMPGAQTAIVTKTLIWTVNVQNSNTSQLSCNSLP